MEAKKTNTKIVIKQIDHKRDTNGVMFRDYDFTIENQGKIDMKIYDNVWGGYVYANDLEDIFYIFNMDHPKDFRGHSLSVSDIVDVFWSDTIQPGMYFVDDFGFKLIHKWDRPQY